MSRKTGRTQAEKVCAKRAVITLGRLGYLSPCQTAKLMRKWRLVRS